MSFILRVKNLLASLIPFRQAIPLSIVQSNTDVELLDAYGAKFAGLPVELRFYKMDAMLRRCINILAGFTVAVAGFDTVLESPRQLDEGQLELFRTQYAHIKEYVDGVNKGVNLDYKLFVACILQSLYGKAAFEKVLDDNQVPVKLHVLPVANDSDTGLQPVLNERTGDLKHYILQTDDGPVKYQPSEILYFVNTDLDESYQGISDVDSILPVCIIRYSLLRQTPQMLKRMYNPYVVACVETAGRGFPIEGDQKQQDQIKKQLTDFKDGIDTGSNIVTNNKVKLDMVQLNIDLNGLLAYDDKLEAKIISYFGIPRFLVNEPNVNRATAETEFTAFVEGTVALRQRYLKRVLESEAWYDLLVRQKLNLKAEDPLPVKVKHVWRDIDMGNVKEKVEAAVALYNNGLGLLGEFPEVAMKTAGLFTAEVQQCLQQQQRLRATQGIV